MSQTITISISDDITAASKTLPVSTWELSFCKTNAGFNE